MVFFTCNACGEALKKNQVEKHYKFKCRNCEVLTCIDCNKDFPGDEYIGHTKCITEDEKYSAKGWTPKANANKGEKKQQMWIDNLHRLIEEAKSNGSLDYDVQGVLEVIVQHENIPRKKAKFTNFLKNIKRGIQPHTIDKTWDLFEEALKKKEEPPAKAKEGDEKVKKNGNSEKAMVNGDEAGEKKKSKKDKKNKQKEENSVSSENEENGKKSKKEKKKDKNKKRQDENEQPGEEVNQSKKAKKRKREDKENNESFIEANPNHKEVEENEEDSSAAETKKRKKFDWDSTIVEILGKKGGEMKVKKLKKKAVAEFLAQNPDSVKSENDLSVKLEKRLSKSDQFKVSKDVVKLVTKEDKSTEEKVDKNPSDCNVCEDEKEDKHQPKTSFNQWENANLGNSVANEKFRRLMGIKNGGGGAGGSSSIFNSKPNLSSVTARDNTQMLTNQEREYERARKATKGRGFGFGGGSAFAPSGSIKKFD